MTEDGCGRNVIFDLDLNLRRPKFDEKHKKNLAALDEARTQNLWDARRELYHGASVSSE